MDKCEESSPDAEGDTGRNAERNADVRVKDEPAEDTIKDYAENTMNELLGLFGYDDKVNSTDTENLNLENYTENQNDDKPGETIIKDRKTSEPPTKDRTADRLRLKQKLHSADEDVLSQQHMNLVTALKRRELEGKESEVDGDSDSSTGPSSSQQCSWCRKTGNKQVTLDTPTGVKVFCNEICFTQCRRASFKKSKTCDWCKHVRHTVNYVEFKDGETQLQFCSEKCLNQYKMSIFCKETQEHLRNVDKTGEIKVDTKDDDEREILITPELWMRGEHARRAAEARESARERERLEKREEKEQRKISSAKSPPKLSYKLDMNDKTRGTLFDRITHEANIKHRRSLITDRETSERASPARSEKQASPSNNNDTLYPAHLLSPWLHQAHLMGALMPGMMPYGHLSPMLLPGMLPPPPPAVLIPDNRDKDNQDDNKKDNKKSQHRRHTTPSLLSPASDVSATAGPSPGLDSKRDVSPSMADRRTSSLFPIDFPQFFAGQNMAAGLPGTTPLGQGIPGIPPVTMMVPFPVPLPLPVPIPIPIPLTVQQLKGLFGDKNDNKTNNMTAMPSVNTDIKETRSPVQSYIHSPQSVVSCGSDLNTYDKQEPRSGSRNSCPDLSMFVGASDLRTKRTNGQQIKRSRTPDSMKSLDLSKRSKYPKYDYNIMCSDSNDGVIDLSASRMNGIKAEDTESENDVSMLNASSDTMMSRDDDDSNAGDAPKVPKIHIITHKDETPLNQPLPLPPTDNSYSSRRGLILDAPTVQKKSRSPSPERRVYVRNVPRDIIEAARRRCMRARIRTK